MGKLDDSNRNKLRNGECPPQPQSGTDLFEGFVHRVDLLGAKKRRAVPSAVDCFAQFGTSLRARPLVRSMAGCDRFMNMAGNRASQPQAAALCAKRGQTVASRRQRGGGTAH
jgi:hypothetical protein